MRIRVRLMRRWCLRITFVMLRSLLWLLQKMDICEIQLRLLSSFEMAMYVRPRTQDKRYEILTRKDRAYVEYRL